MRISRRKRRSWAELLAEAIQPGEWKPTGHRSFEMGELHHSRIGGLDILNVRSPPQWVEHSEKDIDTDAEACYIVSAQKQGQVEIIQDGVAACLSEGDLFFRDSSKPSRVRSDTSGHLAIIKIPKSIVSQMGINWPQEATYLCKKTNVAAAAASAYITEVAESIATVTSNVDVKSSVAENIILNLVTAFECNSSKDDRYRADRLYRLACKIILQRLKDPKLVVAAIAEELGVSKRYLHKLFSRRNQSVEKFIWEQRLQRCRYDILDPDLTNVSLIEIAYNWGFSDPSHFSRAFKTRFGLQPSVLRKLAQPVSYSTHDGL